MIWLDRLRTIKEEAFWIDGYFLILPSDVLRVFVSASGKNPKALDLEETVLDVIQRVGEAPINQPVLCMFCPQPLRSDKFTIIAVSSWREGPKRPMGLAICQSCGGTHVRATEKAKGIFRPVWAAIPQMDLLAACRAGRA